VRKDAVVHVAVRVGKQRDAFHSAKLPAKLHKAVTTFFSFVGVTVGDPPVVSALLHDLSCCCLAVPALTPIFREEHRSSPAVEDMQLECNRLPVDEPRKEVVVDAVPAGREVILNHHVAVAHERVNARLRGEKSKKEKDGCEIKALHLQLQLRINETCPARFCSSSSGRVNVICHTYVPAWRITPSFLPSQPCV
jgi:hypothetical protein